MFEKSMWKLKFLGCLSRVVFIYSETDLICVSFNFFSTITKKYLLILKDLINTGFEIFV